MDLILTDTEIRVLGSLIEKEFTTPEYYPLSLNALTNACNQKTNRNPVVSLGEEEVLRALETLIEKRLVWKSEAGRVAKYEQRFGRGHGIINAELALLATLMLRGAQTAGELRTRCERLHDFKTIEETVRVLEELIERELVIQLERQPGTKENRYLHLLGGQPDESAGQPQFSADINARNARIDVLEEEVRSLRRDLEELRATLRQLTE